MFSEQGRFIYISMSDTVVGKFVPGIKQPHSNVLVVVILGGPIYTPQYLMAPQQAHMLELAP